MNPRGLKIKLLLSGFFVFMLPLYAAADDGSWNKSFSVSGGSIYSEQDDPVIVLEKELLTFNGRETSAYFLFHNTSDQRVTLDCGFPVVHKIDVYFRNDFAEIPLGKYGEAEVPGIEFFETEAHPDLSDDEPIFAWPEVIKINSFNRSREFIGVVPDKLGIDFSVEQDGRTVPVEDVLLERNLDKNYAVLTFHFKHQLEFAPDSRSVVIVRYRQDLLWGNDGGAAADVFRWDYIIGTGGSWKGPIGSFLFIKPQGWEGEPAGMELVSRRMKDGVDVYYAEDYEPARNEEFSLISRPVGMMEEYIIYSDFPGRKTQWKEKILCFPPAEAPAQKIVTSVAASSSLPDRIDVFSDNGVVEAADFGPLSAFDGLPETSWCENVAGHGLGEYLEVELAAPASGVIISNGFKRFTVDDWVFDTGVFENLIRDDSFGLKDYYTMNSRVRTLDIEGLDHDFHAELAIADRRDAQAFFGMNLLPGRYRFFIREVYPGTRWADTCLAEITFIPTGSGVIMEGLFADPFFGQFIRTERYSE